MVLLETTIVRGKPSVFSPKGQFFHSERPTLQGAGKPVDWRCLDHWIATPTKTRHCLRSKKKWRTKTSSSPSPPSPPSSSSSSSSSTYTDDHWFLGEDVILWKKNCLLHVSSWPAWAGAWCTWQAGFHVEFLFLEVLSKRRPLGVKLKKTIKIWVFPKIGVPQNGCFFSWKTLFLMDDLDENPLFWETPICSQHGRPVG